MTNEDNDKFEVLSKELLEIKQELDAVKYRLDLISQHGHNEQGKMTVPYDYL